MSLADGKHLVVIDDDDTLRDQIKQAFEADGFSVTAFGDAFPFRRYIANRGLPHLAIIDLRLPSVHGFQLSEELKALGDVPIVFVSSEVETATVIKGIEEYADDYITKPFDMRELVVRVRRVLSRIPDFSYAQAPVVEIDNWLSIDFANGRVLHEQHHAKLLTPTEASLLYILVNNKGHIVSSDVLLARVWPFEDVYEDTLRVHMHRLRRKVEPNHSRPQYIQTVRGVGYRFIVPEPDMDRQEAKPVLEH